MMLFRGHRGAINGTVPTRFWQIPELQAEMPLPWEDAAKVGPFLLRSKQAPSHFCVPSPLAKALVGLWHYSPQLEYSFLAEGKKKIIIGVVPAWEQEEAHTLLLDTPKPGAVPGQGTARLCSHLPSSLKAKGWEMQMPHPFPFSQSSEKRLDTSLISSARLPTMPMLCSFP